MCINLTQTSLYTAGEVVNVWNSRAYKTVSNHHTKDIFPGTLVQSSCSPGTCEQGIEGIKLLYEGIVDIKQALSKRRNEPDYP